MYSDNRLTFGFFTPHIINSQIAEDFMRGLLIQGNKLDVNIIFYVGGRVNDKNNPLNADEYIYRLVDKEKLDGLIIWTSNIFHNLDDQVIKEFHNYYKGLPILTIGKKVEDLPAIVIDSYTAMKEIVNHFIRDHGYKKIAFISGAINSFYAEERFRGYKDALNENNIIYNEKLVTPPRKIGEDVGRETIKYLLEKNHQKIKIDIEAIVSASDNSLISVIKELKKRGYFIPEDVAVAGFDNLLADLTYQKPLTTVDIFYDKAGILALNTIYNMAIGKKVEPKIYAECKVIYRESCGCKNKVIENACITLDNITNENKEINDLLQESKFNTINAISSILKNIYTDEEQILILSSELFYAITNDIKYQGNHYFIDLLKTLLVSTKNRIENYEHWNNLISVIHKNLIIPEDCTIFAYIDKIFQQARILLHSIFDFYQSEEAVELAKNVSLLLNTSQEIITTTTLDELKYVLSDSCSKLNIKAIYVASTKKIFAEKKVINWEILYEESKKEDQKGSIINFIPDIIFSKKEQTNLILMNLDISKKENNYIIFKIGTTNYHSYVLLKNELKTAYKTISNIKKLKDSEEKTKELVENLSKTNEQLNHALNALWDEMDIAKKIQRSFLPNDFAVEGYDVATYMKSATEVGGDLFDIVKTNGDNYYLTIGDVSGHGVTAGLVMMMMQICNYSNIMKETDIQPDKLANLVNKTLNFNLKQRLKLDHFVTACFIKFDKNGNFSYSGAHEKILIYRKEKNEVEELPTKGMWLAVVDDISNFLTVDYFTLKQGDVALFYTDGVTEICNETKEMYGIERLKNTFKKYIENSAENIIKRIVDNINSFKSFQQDDITLVILKKI